MTVQITQITGELIYNSDCVEITQVVGEVLYNSDTLAVTQICGEILYNSDTVEVTQICGEILLCLDPATTKITQVTGEIICANDIETQITEVVGEVLYNSDTVEVTQVTGEVICSISPETTLITQIVGEVICVVNPETQVTQIVGEVICVNTQFPDLTCYSITQNTSAPVSGGLLAITSTVQNIGEADSGEFKIYYFLSTDGFLDILDTQLYQTNTDPYYLHTGIPALTIGDPFNIILQLPSGTGAYTLFQVIDYDNEIFETNELNNHSVEYNCDILTFALDGPGSGACCGDFVRGTTGSDCFSGCCNVCPPACVCDTADIHFDCGTPVGPDWPFPFGCPIGMGVCAPPCPTSMPFSMAYEEVPLLPTFSNNYKDENSEFVWALSSCSIPCAGLDVTLSISGSDACGLEVDGCSIYAVGDGVVTVSSSGGPAECLPITVLVNGATSISVTDGTSLTVTATSTNVCCTCDNLSPSDPCLFLGLKTNTFYFTKNGKKYINTKAFLERANKIRKLKALNRLKKIAQERGMIIRRRV